MTEPAESTPEPSMKFLLTVTASGAVHDKDGNLLTGDVTGVEQIIVTEAQARALMERNTP